MHSIINSRSENIKYTEIIKSGDQNFPLFENKNSKPSTEKNCRKIHTKPFLPMKKIGIFVVDFFDKKIKKKNKP